MSKSRSPKARALRAAIRAYLALATERAWLEEIGAAHANGEYATICAQLDTLDAKLFGSSSSKGLFAEAK